MQSLSYAFFGFLEFNIVRWTSSQNKCQMEVSFLYTLNNLILFCGGCQKNLRVLGDRNAVGATSVNPLSVVVSLATKLKKLLTCDFLKHTRDSEETHLTASGP